MTRLKATTTRRRKTIALTALLGIVVLGGGAAYFLKQRFLGGVPLPPLRSLIRGAVPFSPRSMNIFAPPTKVVIAPAEFSTWPWRSVQSSTRHPGVRHWMTTARDNTVIELLEFDFAANPNMRFEIYDQDEDDAKPWDNKVDYWTQGAGAAVRKLNARFAANKRGEVVAAWNGLFFGYARNTGGRIAFHVSPVVLNGQVHDWNANHRWTFGVKYVEGKPVFKTFHLPTRATLQKELDWSGGSAQCLIRDGKPLQLQPFPKAGSAPMKQPVASTPAEAGHIPLFDHMKSSRASIGWSRDNTKMYLLFVKEPDSEAASIQALFRGVPLAGGWSVADLQRFWQSKGVWSAINSDAGDVAQLLLLRPDSKYDMAPPRQDNRVNAMRLIFGPDFKGAPQGGALMYFYVRDSQAK